MRILFDSKKEQFKTPFGTLRRGESCILHLWLPDGSGAVGAELILEDCENAPVGERPFLLWKSRESIRFTAANFLWKNGGYTIIISVC